jgi:hypothetical protein
VVADEITAGALEGKFFRQRGGLGYAAQVTVVLTGEEGVELACSGGGWRGQGAIEEASATSHAHWQAGARLGAMFALRIAGREVGVRVVKVAGMTTDSNPTIVALAAARAVWLAVGFTPSTELIKRFEAEVVTSWQRPYDALPRLEDLTAATAAGSRDR